MTTAVRGRIPAGVRPEINRQINAYQSGQQFQPESDRPSFYLAIQREPFYFRYWDKILPQDLDYRHR